jgi:hypothetical protein
MTNPNEEGRDLRRVLSLTRPMSFQEPRAWHVHKCWGYMAGGQRLLPFDPGTWLLEMQPSQVWTGWETTETW